MITDFTQCAKGTLALPQPPFTSHPSASSKVYFAFPFHYFKKTYSLHDERRSCDDNEHRHDWEGARAIAARLDGLARVVVLGTQALQVGRGPLGRRILVVDKLNVQTC